MESNTLNTQQILETLQVQDLTEEEKASKHILKRLVGPIATYNDSTRNGRLYNEKLWNNQLQDEIFQEKIENKSLFLEFGHPQDGREEIDPLKTCACIPTTPKIVNGDLYGVIDVLDTPNGRILNTLIDYGFKPGISSRGSGELGEDNVVDPDSFYLETWDIVPLPAVKKARLSVCESFNGKRAKTLTEALDETYNNATEKDKELMKDTLQNVKENLIKEDIDDFDEEGWVELDSLPKVYHGMPVKTLFVDEFVKESMNEEAELDEAKKDEEVEEPNEDEAAAEAEEVENKDDTADDAKDDDADAEDEKDEAKDKDEEKTAETVAQLAKLIRDLAKEHCKDDKVEFGFEPIEINGQVININGLDISEDSTEDKLVFKFITDYTPEETQDDNIDEPNPEDVTSTEDVAAGDTGAEADDVLESLKDLIRKNDLLENRINSLEKEKTVSDVKVNGLEEELQRYKNGFVRTSELAAKAKKYEKDNKALVESLSETKKQNVELSQKLARQAQLTESLNSNSEQLKAVKDKYSQLEKDFKVLKESTSSKNASLENKMKELAEGKAKSDKKVRLILTRYIESKANLLGVSSNIIIERLGKSYSLDDIDGVCDQILEESVNLNSVKYGNTRNSLRETSPAKRVNKTPAQDDYSDIDPILLELAGLK